jgi:hypothetical protein
MSVTASTGITPAGLAAILAGTRTGHDDRQQAGERSHRRGSLRDGNPGPGTGRIQPRGGSPLHQCLRCRIKLYLDQRRRLRRRWPGVSAGLWPWRGPARRTPGHTGRTDKSNWLIRHTDQCREQPSPSLPIVQLAVTASMAALRAVACDRLRRTIDRRLLTRILAAAREADENEAGPFQKYESEDPPIG